MFTVFAAINMSVICVQQEYGEHNNILYSKEGTCNGRFEISAETE